MPGVSAGTISANAVTLQPGVPGTVVAPAAAGTFASYLNDNTIAGGLNAAGITVTLGWQAWNGTTWHQLAGGRFGGGQSTCEIDVSVPAEAVMVALVAVQPDAAGPSVTLAPAGTATAV